MELKEERTKILAVGNDLSVLIELNGVLEKIFPQADVIKETDPLMACKYSFNNAVNLVFAFDEMKRMSGSDLLQFIKKEHPSVKTYLIYKDAARFGNAICDESDGVIKYPFSAEEVVNTVKLCRATN